MYLSRSDFSSLFLLIHCFNYVISYLLQSLGYDIFKPHMSSSSTLGSGGGGGGGGGGSVGGGGGVGGGSVGGGGNSMPRSVSQNGFLSSSSSSAK